MNLFLELRVNEADSQGFWKNIYIGCLIIWWKHEEICLIMIIEWEYENKDFYLDKFTHPYSH